MIQQKTPPACRKRAVQKRAEETKSQILAAAIGLFSTFGYEGVSIRTVESQARVKRGLVAYHFGPKEELWKAAVDALFGDSNEMMIELATSMMDLAPEARSRAAIGAFVRFSAQRPEVSRLMVQEGRARSWRLDYLLEHYVRPRVDWITDALGEKLDAHRHYMMLGAATFVFDVESECEALFDVDPRTEEFANDHANAVSDMISAMRAQSGD
jgi:AcrR family transcriptional regulator